MIGTVDLVIAGDGNGALAAAVEALQRGRRILVLVRSSDARAGRRLSQRLRNRADVGDGQLMVLTNVEVVCVDGIAGVEVVVVRHRRTGRLSAVNASAFVASGDATPRRGDGRPW